MGRCRAPTRLRVYAWRRAQECRSEARSPGPKINEEVINHVSRARSLYLYGTGRRKSSVARVRLYPNGTGSITINGRDIDDYFGLDTLKLVVRQPLVADRHRRQVRRGLPLSPAAASPARPAPCVTASPVPCCGVNEEYRPVLKKAGFLTRDPRMKERKKYGLKAARRAPQFSKR